MTMFSGYKAGSLYVLEKDLPQMSAGAIFELREPTKERGSIGCGFLTNIWVNGGCQSSWAAETHVLPGQLAHDREWFTPVRKHKSSPHIFTVNGVRFSRMEDRS
ncbi:hypothetical protein [Dietzia natronolimnaea]|uniref:hypothetical protein n=1 Tax=Dietzia natronolimnaea TaxID=161920 RepID=UPI0015FC3724|nr:hypothetical protein [Dietzia natronolimnaea]MBB1037355.1 hypothetical protein [Dietzia natronolimnaea]